MLVAIILFDMVLLAVEIWLSPDMLQVTVALCAIFVAIRALLGVAWLINMALAVAGVSALFILSQAGQSAWGSNLMLYLLPIQLANAFAFAAALFAGALGRYRT